MTIDVTEVNHAPIGTNNTVTTLENTGYTFATANFGFSDPNDTPPNNFLAVDVTTLPGSGTLNDNGEAVAPASSSRLRHQRRHAGLQPSRQRLRERLHLLHLPGRGRRRHGQRRRRTSMPRQDHDHQRDRSQSRSDGTNNTVTTLENTAYTFATADFGFSDPNDTPPNNFLAVEITTLPAGGTLTDNGVAVTAGRRSSR